MIFSLVPELGTFLLRMFTRLPFGLPLLHLRYPLRRYIYTHTPSHLWYRVVYVYLLHLNLYYTSICINLINVFPSPCYSICTIQHDSDTTQRNETISIVFAFTYLVLFDRRHYK